MELHLGINQKSVVKFLIKLITITGTILAIIVGVIELAQHKKESRIAQLSGAWDMHNVIDKTNHDPFQDLKLGYRLHFTQEADGNLSGYGEKVTENGIPIPFSSRINVEFTGINNGESVSIAMKEHGKRRETTCALKLYVINKDSLAGSFSSTAANSSGRSYFSKVN